VKQGGIGPPCFLLKTLDVVTFYNYNCTVRFEWDETKRRTNIRKHGIDFVDAKEVFRGVTLTIEDTRFDYGEIRYVTVGSLKGRVVVVAHTENDDVIRVISIRKGTKNEETKYFKEVPD
jgi:hypothetical protein